MRQKKLKLSASIILCFGITGLHAQEIIPAMGGNISGSGGTVSYSIGQVVYNTSTGINGSIAQGVQQPYEISVITGLEEAGGITLQCTAYPNPATDHIVVEIDTPATLSIQAMLYQLYDGNGKLIVIRVPDGNQTFIPTENLVPSTYYLKIMQSNKEIKLFKIIKK